ncbi:MAG: DUF2782 domain-containing protein [Gammaproteobacteria bacterium]|nr:DUF2782 domain-containing protein [Gammaproteobacteria bacterium]
MFYKTPFSSIVCAVALIMSANVFAAGDIAQPPVLPEPLMDGESIEPEINIIQKEDRKIEEYRVNGQLYMIKVTPTIGAPYYFMDTDGDGSLESQQHELSGHLVPNWVLLEW